MASCTVQSPEALGLPKQGYLLHHTGGSWSARLWILALLLSISPREEPKGEQNVKLSNTPLTQDYPELIIFKKEQTQKKF